MCLSFGNEDFPASTCARELADPESHAEIVRQAKMHLRSAYALAGGRQLVKGEGLSDAFVRCGSVWVDMPVQEGDQAVLRAYFRRQPLSLLIGGQNVRFQLVGDSVSLTTSISTTASTTATTTTSNTNHHHYHHYQHSDPTTTTASTTTTTASTTTTTTSTTTTTNSARIDLTSYPNTAAPPAVAQQFGVQGDHSSADAGVSSVVIAVLGAVVVLGVVAAVGYVVVRKKHRKERDYAASGPSSLPVAENYEHQGEEFSITVKAEHDNADGDTFGNDDEEQMTADMRDD